MIVFLAIGLGSGINWNRIWSLVLIGFGVRVLFDRSLGCFVAGVGFPFC